MGIFTVTTEAPSFTRLMTDRRFPTRFVILEATVDEDRTRARIAILQSLGSRVVLVADGRGDRSPWPADAVVDPALPADTLDALIAAERDVLRRSSRPRPAQPLTPITPREREALEVWQRLGSIRLMSEELNVGYQTATTLLKRARAKLKAGIE